MQVAVVGAGAMGSVYGAAFFTGGHEVVMIDALPEVVDAISSDGLTIVDDGQAQSFPVSASANPSDVGTVDLVLVLVKGYHTEAAVEFASPLMGKDTILLTLQNGWGNGERIAEAAGSDRLVIGVSYHSASLLGPGRVSHTARGLTRIGPLTGDDTSLADRVADGLREGGFECEVTPTIRREAWKKLVLNSAALPPAALTSLLASELAEQPIWELVRELASETIAVGQALGFDLDLPAELAHVQELLVAAGQAKASMLQDVELRRRTEIDTINGAVVRLALQHNTDAPLNNAMVRLIRGLEQARGIYRPDPAAGQQ